MSLCLRPHCSNTSAHSSASLLLSPSSARHISLRAFLMAFSYLWNYFCKDPLPSRLCTKVTSVSCWSTPLITDICSSTLRVPILLLTLFLSSMANNFLTWENIFICYTEKSFCVSSVQQKDHNMGTLMFCSLCTPSTYNYTWHIKKTTEILVEHLWREFIAVFHSARLSQHLSNNNENHYATFIPVAVLKIFPAKKQLIEERIYLVYSSRIQSIMVGRSR